MASKSSAKKPTARKPPSSQGAARKKAASPSQKARASQPTKPQPARDPIITDTAHRNISAIVCAVAALALILIVAWPTNAVVTSFLSLALRMVFGIGAYLLPILLVIVAATFVAKFENERMPTRIVLGLCIIFFGLLVLVALFTPGALDSQGVTGELLSDKQVIYRGGYLGAGPAWVGLTCLGLPVSVVLAIGIMAIGFAIIGFSVRKLFEIVEAKRRLAEDREEQELGVLPDTGYVPAMPARMKHSPVVDGSAKTLLIGEDEIAAPRGTKTSRLDNQVTGQRSTPNGGKAQSRSLTRKLGSQELDPEQQKPTKATAATTTAKAAEPAIESVAPDSSFILPSRDLLKTSREKKRSKAAENELAETAARLQQTMEDFGIMATVVDWIAGPTVTLFEVDLPPGVRVSRLTALNDDIALALAAPGVRIFAPIPGTHYVGIEVPNATRETVLLGDILKEIQGGPLQVAIGKDVEGNAITEDLAKMPHLLIGGTTGSGKSVGINAMIMSILMRATPSQVRFIMIDPKRVEFAPYDGIPHLYVPVVTEPKEAASALSWGVAEMELRLKTFQAVGVRNIGSYNQLVASGKLRKMIDDGSLASNKIPQSHQQFIDASMPYIVIVIDELADLMMNVGKEVEFSISRIAQLARAAGIHLIVATQRPSANVVTGLIKANITTRIAYNVASGLDSRVILDTSGAESLIGLGDLLLSKPELGKPLRVQGCFTSDEEIEAVVEAVKSQGEPEYHSEILKTNLISLGDTMPDGSGGSGGGGDDPLIWEAAEIVVASGLGSTSNIQRKLKVGYSRAGRIMDMLEEKGVVGPPNGSKPRDVLVDAMELETLKAFEQADE